MKHYQHYINGAFCDPVSGSYFDTENPTLAKFGQRLRRVMQDVDVAVKAARAAFEGDWVQ